MMVSTALHRAFFAAGSAIAACCWTPAAAAAADPPLPSLASSGAANEVLVGGHRLRLIEDGGTCSLEHAYDGGEASLLRLQPGAPCLWLTWTTPPGGQTSSGGVALGSTGTPRAYTYADAGNVIVLAVLTGKLPEAWASRAVPGETCTAAIQAVLIRGDTVKLSGRVSDRGRPACSGSGMDEKDYWMFGHDE